LGTGRHKKEEPGQGVDSPLGGKGYGKAGKLAPKEKQKQGTSVRGVYILRGKNGASEAKPQGRGPAQGERAVESMVG